MRPTAYTLEKKFSNLSLKSKKNLLWRLLLVLDKKYFVVQRFLKDVVFHERGIKKYGIVNQCKKFINKLNLEVKAYSHIDNGDLSKHKGQLIYGINHQAIIEPIILYSLQKSSKVRLVIYRAYYLLGKNIQKYSLPVAGRFYSSDSVNEISEKLNFYQQFIRIENLSYEMIKEMNQKSLVSASKFLESGGTVLMFPAGGGNELKKWRTGISRIILNVSERKRSKVKILPVYFSGLGKKRLLLRVLKTYLDMKVNKKLVNAYFGKARTLSNLFSELGKNKSEDNIIDFLRKDAYQQYGLKDNRTKAVFVVPQFLYGKLAFAVRLLVNLIPFREFSKYI